MTEGRRRLEALFKAGLAAADPERLVAEAAGAVAPGAALRVLAVGKAAASMFRGFRGVRGDAIVEALVATKEGHGLEGEPDPIFGGHPVPDARSAAVGERARALAARVQPQEHLVVLLSGGASALGAEPDASLSLDDLVRTTSTLLEAGLDIHGLNAVRKHLTRGSGGRLAEAASAAAGIHVLAISDVPGDSLATIGSGPCEPDPTTFADAIEAAHRVGAFEGLPEAVRRHLEAGRRGERAESPKPGVDWAARVTSRVLASNATALEAVAAAARADGLPVHRADEPLAGEAREVGRRLADLPRRSPEVARLVIAGGETTVTVRGPGRGGRSQELALAAALDWDAGGAPPDACLLAAGTDGTDGPTEAAGAFADPETVRRGREQGVEAALCLERNDSHGFFAREGGLFVTGPTRTNVMDLALVAWGFGA